MATLTNTKIKDTYDGLLKTTDNDVIGASEKVITDGLGNASVLSIGTDSASFSSDIEVNTLTIGKGNGSLSTNTAIGVQTLENTSGIGNTAVGYASLLDNTTGAGNSAVGLNTLRYNTSGAWGTAVGYEALKENTTGQGNTAFGAVALQDNTIGTDNTAVGYISLSNNIDGVANTAVGYGSLGTNTGGDYNVAVGYTALNANTTGEYNVAIGSGAGDTNTTGSNNIYIGYDAVGSAATNDNEIVIGTSATGNGSNTATYGNSSITKHIFTNGSLGIGTDLPTENLQIESVGSSFIYMSSGTASPATLGIKMGQSISSGSAEAEVSYDVADDLFQIKTGTAASTRRLTIEKNSGKVDITNDFAVDTDTLYVDAANNRVGIGTSAPDSRFSVVSASANSSAAQIGGIEYAGVQRGLTIKTFQSAGADDCGIEFNAADGIAGYGSFVFKANTDEFMRIDSSGNVGIGTDNPVSDSLTLYKSTYPYIYIQNSSSGTAASDGLRLGLEAGTEARLDLLENLPLVFRTNATERMRIDSSGNVGIGDSNPVGFTRTLKINTTSGTTGILLSESGTDRAGFYAEVGTTTPAYLFTNNSKPLVFNVAGGEAMRIDSSGNVGIGSSSLDSNLVVNGSSNVRINLRASEVRYGTIFADSGVLAIASITSIPLVLATNDTERMRIDSSGNVGIGNSVASSFNQRVDAPHLVVGSGSNSAGLTLYSGTNSQGTINFADGLTTTEQYMGGIVYVHGSDNYMAFNTNGASERMRIDSSGNVGIGISPSYRMHIHNPSTDVSATSDLALGVISNDSNTNARALLKASKAGTNGGQLTFSTLSANVLSERMRITSGGFLKASDTGTYLNATASYHELYNTIGGNQILQASQSATTNPYGIGMKFVNASPNNTTSWFIRAEDSTTAKFYVYSNGNVVNTNNSYGAISDAKLKENIVDASPKLDDLMQVKVRNFNYIGDDKKQLGVVAQELEKVFPSMIDESPDFEEQEVIDEEGNVTKERVDLGTTTKSVKYSVFVPMLIKAIQELKAEIELLKSRRNG